MDYLEILSLLEDELRDKKGFFGKKEGGKGVELVGQLREILPQMVAEAERVVEQKKEILRNADTVARNTLESAQTRAEHIVGTTEIMRRAEDESAKMLERASDRCDLLVKKTKEHLDSMFVETEQFLLSALNMIRANRDELREALIIKK